jgi:hypothetical protein
MAFEGAFLAPLDHVADLIEIRPIVFASAGGMESSSSWSPRRHLVSGSLDVGYNEFAGDP